MPGDPPLVDGRQLREAVRQIIADVLVVALEEVQPGKALVRDLGAESIDFMDLVFRLEDVLGFKIPFPSWQRFIEETLEGQDLAVAITPEVVELFAEQQLAAV
jgi:acyl carrier protein